MPRASGATLEAHFIICGLLPPRPIAKLLLGTKMTGAGAGNRIVSPIHMSCDMTALPLVPGIKWSQIGVKRICKDRGKRESTTVARIQTGISHSYHRDPLSSDRVSWSHHHPNRVPAKIEPNNQLVYAAPLLKTLSVNLVQKPGSVKHSIGLYRRLIQ